VGKKKSKGYSLKKVSNRCLYVDEIIDLKWLNDMWVLLCSNNEYLKLVNLHTGEIEIYQGHTSILLSVDVVSMPDEEGKWLCLSAAKDNEIRMWYTDLS